MAVRAGLLLQSLHALCQGDHGGLHAAYYTLLVLYTPIAQHQHNIPTIYRICWNRTTQTDIQSLGSTVERHLQI